MINERTNQQTKMNEWMNELMNEWMNKWSLDLRALLMTEYIHKIYHLLTLADLS